MDAWPADNAVQDLGFFHRCFLWFPGGGWRGRMALHSHSGAPATYLSRLLADGVGAGSERDRHGDCGRGKGPGHTAACSRGRGGQEIGSVSADLAVLQQRFSANPFLSGILDFFYFPR